MVRKDIARPVSSPWARKNCQYSSQSDVRKIPRTTAVQALASSGYDDQKVSPESISRRAG
jgi:hypothetical protein